MEFRGGRQDSRHRQLLPAGGLPEPQPLGRRGLPEDNNPAFEIRRLPLRPRGRPDAQPLRRVLARAPHRRHPRGTGEDRRAVGRRPSGLPAQAWFSKAETGRIVETVLSEEGRPPESVFDFVQGITAVARSKPQQDARFVMEGKAKALLASY